MNESEIFIVGADGQLGTELRAKYPAARFADKSELDITSKESVANFDWTGVQILINAAAYTNVDGAETTEGRVVAWAVNADAVGNLVAVAAQHSITLVHISTDYVFDGTQEQHAEDEAFSPLSVYGASKAAGDLLVSLAPKFYILRTSWVIGSGKNFVRSIMGLAEKNISPSVVADQYGRLTFTSEIVRAVDLLLEKNAAFGTYNISNSGDVVSWADIARQVYASLERTDLTVTNTTAAEYFADKVSAARPAHSGLDLTKIQRLGFEPKDWRSDLSRYIAESN